jgi:hypothetical protein
MIGQQFLQKEFGIHPRVSWNVDSFGISSGYARLAHDVGFDLMMYSRVDSLEKKHMRETKSRTQVWRPHENNLGKRNDILGITMDQQKNKTLGAYCWPTGFWADTNYLMDAPIVLERNKPDYRLDEMVRSLY